MDEEEFTAPPPIVPAKAPSEKKKEEPSIDEDYNVDDFVLDEDNISLDYGDVKWKPKSTSITYFYSISTYNFFTII